MPNTPTSSDPSGRHRGGWQRWIHRRDGRSVLGERGGGSIRSSVSTAASQHRPECRREAGPRAAGGRVEATPKSNRAQRIPEPRLSPGRSRSFDRRPTGQPGRGLRGFARWRGRTGSVFHGKPPSALANPRGLWGKDAIAVRHAAPRVLEDHEDFGAAPSRRRRGRRAASSGRARPGPGRDRRGSGWRRSRCKAGARSWSLPPHSSC
jgi:hypothetical protein